jgi:hypothetical protein
MVTNRSLTFFDLEINSTNQPKHCCEDLTNAINFKCARCDADHAQFDCSDALIFYSRLFDEYGIIVKDGGSSFSQIQYCPYCGTKFPSSRRDAWFETLEKLGFDNPLDQDIPEEFLSGAWLKK